METLSQSIETFLKIDRSPYTTRDYRRILTRMAEAIGPRRSLDLITDADLLDYVARLRQSDQLKPATINQYSLVIKVFFNWCVKSKRLPVSPAADLRIRQLELEHDASRAVPPDVLAGMTELTGRDTRFKAIRNHAILLFLADTGCRVGAVASLTLERLHLNECFAEVTEKGNRRVRVFFGEETAEALRRWLLVRPQTEHGVVFTKENGKPFRKRSYATMIKRISGRVTGNRTYSPHQIRHAVGHAWAKRGLPITATARKLNHRNLSATQRYYPHDDEYLRQVSQSLSLASLHQPPPPSVDTPVEAPPQPKPKVIKFPGSA
jgi:site-specific recombinase XerD